jgi:hypothetical protein
MRSSVKKDIYLYGTLYPTDKKLLKGQNALFTQVTISRLLQLKHLTITKYEHKLLVIWYVVSFRQKDTDRPTGKGPSRHKRDTEPSFLLRECRDLKAIR